ncbi:MAG: T9SS type A sorting domain-containing protein [Bacteroidales bacterium]
MKKTSILLLLFLFSQILFAQKNWPKTYYKDKNISIETLDESYDGGYSLSGWFGWSRPEYCWLKKVDINGNELWNKIIGGNNTCTYILGHKECENGDIYLYGGTDLMDPTSDPVVIKLNACGDIIWGRIFHVPYKKNYCAVKLLLKNNQDGCIVCIRYPEGTDDKRVGLMSLDNNGNIEWKGNFPTKEEFWSEDIQDADINDNGDIIVCGRTYWPEKSANKDWLKAFHFMVNKDGEILWQNAVDPDFFMLGEGRTYSSLIVKFGKNGNIYSSILREFNNTNLRPYLYQIDPSGKIVNNFHIKKEAYRSSLRDFEFLPQIENQPQEFIGNLTAIIEEFKSPEDIKTRIQMDYKLQEKQRKETPDGHSYAIKFNSKGEILKEVEIGERLADVIKTHDNKYLFYTCPYPGEKKNADAWLYKFNDKLEPDTLYTQAREYDYLCKGNINQDTIFIASMSVVDLEEIEQNTKNKALSIYPNPARGMVNIKLPKFIEKQESIQGVKIQQQIFNYHKNTSLEIVDINGKIIYSQAIEQQQNQIQINTSNWQKGIYLVRLLQSGDIICKGKLICE